MPPSFSATTATAIVRREWLVFRRVWFSTASGSVLEPIVYFLAFGYGLGRWSPRSLG